MLRAKVEKWLLGRTTAVNAGCVWSGIVIFLESFFGRYFALWITWIFDFQFLQGVLGFSCAQIAFCSDQIRSCKSVVRVNCQQDQVSSSVHPSIISASSSFNITCDPSPVTIQVPIVEHPSFPCRDRFSGARLYFLFRRRDPLFFPPNITSNRVGGLVTCQTSTNTARDD